MNNDMQNQNNQGMANNGMNQPNNQGFINNNMSQPNNQGFINNNMSQPNNQGFMNPNANVMNNLNQTDNNAQFNNPNLQFNQSQNPNDLGNMQASSPASNKGSKKINVKVIGIVVVVIILAFVLVKFLSKSSSSSIIGSKKTLTCTTHHAILQTVFDETYVYYIDDESASSKYTQKYDLEKSTGMTGDFETWKDEKVAAMKKDCDSVAGCKFDYKYSAGKYLELTTSFDKEFFSDQVKGMTAEEIYNKLKTNLESGKVGGYTFICN